MSATPDSDADRDHLSIHLAIESDEELRALRGALLAARATELSEVQRRAQRHELGYGTESQRDSMSAEVENLRRRWTMLDRLLAAIDRAVNDRQR
jgi:hypothetical protein